MPPVKVGPCVTATQVSRPICESADPDIFNGDGSGQMRTARGRGGVKNGTFLGRSLLSTHKPRFTP